MNVLRIPKMAAAGVVATIVGGLLSSRSGGIPGDDEADKVVDPPLEDLDESPLGPPGVPRSKRRGEGGEIAGVEETDVVALFVEGVLVADVIKARVDERFFWAFSGTLAKTIH